MSSLPQMNYALSGARPFPISVSAVAIATLLLATLGLAPFFSGHVSERLVTNSAESERSPQVQRHTKLPLSFEPNVGQAGSGFDFVARGGKSRILLNATEMSVSAEGDNSGSATMTAGLIEANRDAKPRVLEELPGKVNYLIGNDKNDWHTDVATYARIRYNDVYPGIDLTYYGNNAQLEFDFIVEPGSDPDNIRFAFEEARRVTVDGGNSLVVTGAAGKMRWKRPFIFQEVDGTRKIVPGSYEILAGNRVGFDVGDFDPTHSLVIDPVLGYSTYLGGSDFDEGHDIGVDSNGNTYVTGETESLDFPTGNAFQASHAGGGKDAFVTKIDPTGTTMLYSTYLGGSGDERPRSLDVDATGNTYVAGATFSTDFPTLNAFQNANAGQQDAYITKLDPDGGLTYSTYFGGKGNDGRTNVAVDGFGDIHLSGFTQSTNFPLLNAIQTEAGGQADAYVAKFNAAGDALIYSTRLGGSDHDTARGVDADEFGNTYLTGWTMSGDFPTTNAFQPTYGGGNTDIFVTKVAADGSALVFSTFLGGSDEEWNYQGGSIAVDSDGGGYVTGYTFSPDFPTSNAFQATLGGERDVIVTKLDASGALVYSSFLGGGSGEEGIAIAVDSSFQAILTGLTYSVDFPTADASQDTKGGSKDAFATRVSADGSALVYSTYLGGSSDDQGMGIAVDLEGSIHVGGWTSSSDFPTMNPLQGAKSGFHDAFVTKLIEGEPPPPPPSDDTTPPTVSMRKPNADQLLATRTVRVSWVGEDDVGISRYDLYERIGTSGSQTLVQSSSSTKYNRSGDHGETYCYQVYAYDTSGNEGVGEERCAAVPYDDTSTAITYTGGVSQLAAAGAYQNTLTVLDGAGQEAEASFTGRKVGVLVRKDSLSGKAHVYLDDIFERSIDLYSAKTKNKVYILTRTFTSGPHSIRVVWTGEQNPSSTGTAIQLDGIAVISE